MNIVDKSKDKKVPFHSLQVGELCKDLNGFLMMKIKDAGTANAVYMAQGSRGFCTSVVPYVKVTPVKATLTLEKVK